MGWCIFCSLNISKDVFKLICCVLFYYYIVLWLTSLPYSITMASIDLKFKIFFVKNLFKLLIFNISYALCKTHIYSVDMRNTAYFLHNSACFNMLFLSFETPLISGLWLYCAKLPPPLSLTIFSGLGARLELY